MARDARETRFDSIVALAKAIVDVAIVRVDLCDEDDADLPGGDRESVSARVLADGRPHQAISDPGTDAGSDGAPPLRFHAGIPVTDGIGKVVAVLSLRDPAPRAIDADALRNLSHLADCAAAIIRADGMAARLRETEEDLHWATTLSPQMPWRADAQGAPIEVAPNVLDRTGSSFENVRGGRWLEDVSVADRDRVRQAWEHAVATGERFDIEFRATMRDGAPRWMRGRASPRFDAVGRIVRWYGLIEDMHAFKVAQIEKEEALHRLTIVLESTTDHVALFDHAWRVTYVNHVMARTPIFAAARGRVVWEALPYLRDTLYERRVRAVASEQVGTQFEWYSARAGGWLEVNAYPTPDGVAIFAKDINQRYLLQEERDRHQQRIAYQMRHDEITGLPNRLSLAERVHRMTEGGVGALLLHVGMDNFRSVHALAGPAMAASLLVALRDRLEQAVTGCELIAHFGGEDFGILYPLGASRPPDALARAVLAAVEDPLQLQGTSFVASVSIGIAEMPGDADDAEDLFRKAAIALDHARSCLSSRWSRFDPAMQRTLEERQRLRLDLRKASLRDELSINYQPLVDLPDGRITGFEALLRWRHPERGSVPPDIFIPIAEETGLITEIGGWVLRRACRDAMRWPRDVRVSVNLSPVQFHAPDLVTMVFDMLGDSGLAAGRLKLEVTESILLRDSDANLEMLHALRDAGILVVLDDFGTGYASLGYLRSFPFHKLKIDRSFITGIDRRPKSQAIVRSVLGLAKTLDVGITAEGVETPGELRWLIAEGCDQVQGYLTGRPMPAARIVSFLAAHGGHSAQVTGLAR